MSALRPVPSPADAKAYAVNEIARLMRTYGVSIDDIGGIAVTAAQGERGMLLTRILSYIGGTLVVAGLCIYLGMQWDKLDGVLRVALTYGPGLCALVVGIVAVRGKHPPSAHIATPMFLMAAIFQSGGLFVYLAEFVGGQDAVMGMLIVCSAMAAQFGVLFYAMRQPFLLLLTLVFAHFTFAAIFELMDMDGRLSTTVLGLSGLLIAAGLSKTSYRPISGLGFLFSGGSFAIGYYALVTDWGRIVYLALEPTLIGVAAALIYASVMVQSRALLFVGVVAMLGYLAHYTEMYFSKITGWPIALMALGIIMIVAANYAVKLGRRFKHSA